MKALERSKEWLKSEFARHKHWLIASVVLAIALIVVGATEFALVRSKKIVEKENESLKGRLITAEGEIAQLDRTLREKLDIISSFEGQISGLSGVVGNLQKLAKTDEELLAKYSKVFFLNENYLPEKLEQVEPDYALVQNDSDMLVHSDVWPHLKGMLDAARADGVELYVSSAFRSFDAQASIKNGYKVTYGAGTANQFSADQGYSEHQLGTAVDLATKSSGAASLKFESDSAYDWLQDNAHRYGFVLSYPKGNTYYIFEPWHWRFVGRELATRLHDEGKNFYDLDQREIDEYLVKLFD